MVYKNFCQSAGTLTSLDEGSNDAYKVQCINEYEYKWTRGKDDGLWACILSGIKKRKSGSSEQFLKERRRYEDEIDGKKSEVPMMEVASYKSSNDKSLQENMNFTWWLEDISLGVELDVLKFEDIRNFTQILVSTPQTAM